MSFYLDCRQRGNNLLLRYIHKGEERIAKVNNYTPSLFVMDGQKTKYNELITGKTLSPKHFKSIKDANSFLHETSGAVYGNRNFNYTFIHENFKNTEEYDVSKIRVFNIDIECPSEKGFPDPDKAEWEINALTIYDNITDKYYVWGLGEFSADDDELKKYDICSDRIVYKGFTDELSMMKSIVGFWQRNYPVAVTGWNTSTFDLPYMHNRLVRLGLDPNKLSPWGITTIREFELFGRTQQSVNMLGINDLDYLDLYKKNRFITRSSYKLGAIGHIELGRAKVDFAEEAANLRTLHKANWQKYIVYNIIDVDLVKKLDDKLGFLDVTFAVAYFAGINFSDVKSPVATWENIMYRNTINDNIILPPKKDHDTASYEGGYVKAPQVGKHKWVVSFDLNSLYPHLIMMFNISPETITDNFLSAVNVDMMTERTPYKNDTDLAVAPSGNMFRKDVQGIAGFMMDKLYKERKTIKKEGLVHEQDAIDAKAGERLDELATIYGTSVQSELIERAEKLAVLKDGGQMVRKILLNSFYGALANVYFNLFDIRLAESITKSGQLSIRWVGRIVNENMNKMLNTKEVDYVVYTDTDSIYVTMESVVDKCGMTDKPTNEIVDFLDKFCDSKMLPVIEAGYQDLKEYTNAYQQKMVMAREVISDNSVFCAKKMYAMSVWNSEGVAFTEPYIKVMGLSLVKSSTPQACRDAMKDTMKLILNGTEGEVQSYVKGFKKDFKKLKVEEIAFPRGTNKLEESYCFPDGRFRSDVTVPINSRAAINYNNELTKLDLHQYERVYNGDKIKYVMLELPNRLQQNVIGFVDILPEEFKISHKVDYDVMFEKTYLKSISDILATCGWTAEFIPTLEGIFGERPTPRIPTEAEFHADEDEDDSWDVF